MTTTDDSTDNEAPDPIRLFYSRKLAASAAALLRVEAPEVGLAVIVLSVVAVEATVNELFTLTAREPESRIRTLEPNVQELWDELARKNLSARTDRTPLEKRIRMLGRALVQKDDVFTTQPTFRRLKLVMEWRNHIAHSRPEPLVWQVDRYGWADKHHTRPKLRADTYKALGMQPPRGPVVGGLHELLGTTHAGAYACTVCNEARRDMTDWFPAKYAAMTGYVSFGTRVHNANGQGDVGPEVRADAP